MTSAREDAEARAQLHSMWTGVWCIEGALIGAVAFVFAAFARELGDCSLIGGCTPVESETGTGAVALFVVAAFLAVGGVVAGALASGWSRTRGLVQGVGAAVAGAATLLAAWEYHDELDSYVTPVVVAAAVATALAIRPAGGPAGALRAVAVALLCLTAIAIHESLASFLLPFLSAPAVGLADALALRIATPRGS